MIKELPFSTSVCVYGGGGGGKIWSATQNKLQPPFAHAKQINLLENVKNKNQLPPPQLIFNIPKLCGPPLSLVFFFFFFLGGGGVSYSHDVSYVNDCRCPYWIWGINHPILYICVTMHYKMNTNSCNFTGPNIINLSTGHLVYGLVS